MPADPTAEQLSRLLELLCGINREPFYEKSDKAFARWEKTFNADKNCIAFVRELAGMPPAEEPEAPVEEAPAEETAEAAEETPAETAEAAGTEAEAAPAEAQEATSTTVLEAGTTYTVEEEADDRFETTAAAAGGNMSHGGTDSLVHGNIVKRNGHHLFFDGKHAPSVSLP